MSNPWAQFGRRPSVHGQPRVTAGARRVGELPMPPALGDLMHWFDFSDIDTLFQDIASTVPVTADSQPIRSILNKGFDGTKLATGGAQVIFVENFIFVENLINARAGGEFGGTEVLSAVIAAGGINQQVTIASVQRVDSQGANAAHYYGWDTNKASLRDDIGGAGRDYDGLLGGITFRPNTGAAIANFVSHWFYAALDTSPGADIAKTRDSTIGTELSFSAVGTNPFVGPGEVLAIGDLDLSGLDLNTLRGNMGMVLIWNTFLNTADRNAIPDYFEAYYDGVFPI